ncbi:MAG: thiamine phosphate synthase, partial [Candidatus Eremiobacteraeota bacterium]|nr:thiamine phosphate synthase [Candidatus Eremiobacteraeota bacterium]
MLSGIYAIVDAAEGEPLAQLADVLAGGVRVVQYRAKSGVRRELLVAMHERARTEGAVLLVNDELALIADCDGVHLGQEDLEAIDSGLLAARCATSLLGISCPDAESARAAAGLGADYVG